MKRESEKPEEIGEDLARIIVINHDRFEGGPMRDIAFLELHPPRR